MKYPQSGVVEEISGVRCPFAEIHASRLENVLQCRSELDTTNWRGCSKGYHFKIHDILYISKVTEQDGLSVGGDA